MLIPVEALSFVGVVILVFCALLGFPRRELRRPRRSASRTI